MQKNSVLIRLSLTLAIVWSTCSGCVAHSQTVVPIGSQTSQRNVQALGARPASAPDVQILVISGVGSEDQLNLTYAGVIPAVIVHRDLAGLISSANWRLHNVEVTNTAIPMSGVVAPPMTSVFVYDTGAAPVNLTYFPIDRIITALKNYKALSVTYVMSPRYQFNGLRSYANRYVHVNLAQVGSSYTYHVNVVDNSFSRLDLPTMQITGTSVADASPQSETHGTLWKVAGVLLVTGLAAGVGFGVYTVLVRLQ